MLELQGVKAFYGATQALFGVDLHCRAGRITTLLGRNGMGKTTTVRAILNQVAVTAGDIRLDGESLRGLRSFEIARRGIGLAPEGRQIFPNLSVRENLIATAAGVNGRSAWTLARVLACFPALGARLQHAGHQLSGGEQQMLAIGRALMVNPRLLILDEAAEGLAPLIRATIWRQLQAIKQSGIAILLIDKHVDEFIDIADAHCIMEKGAVVWRGDSARLQADGALKARYLGV